MLVLPLVGTLALPSLMKRDAMVPPVHLFHMKEGGLPLLPSWKEDASG